jgi:hypothetical protein
VLRVKYEDLCRDVDTVLGGVFAFIGVQPGITATAAANRQMHVLGNRARLNGLLPIRLDESWRYEMASDDIATFAIHAGELNARYGYGAAGE